MGTRLSDLFNCATLKSWGIGPASRTGQVYILTVEVYHMYYFSTTTIIATVPHKGVAQRAIIILTVRGTCTHAPVAVWTKILTSSMCLTYGLHMYMCQVKYWVMNKCIHLRQMNTVLSKTSFEFLYTCSFVPMLLNLFKAYQIQTCDIIGF